MRSRLFTQFVMLIVLLAALSGVACAAELTGFAQAAENEFLELYYKAETAEIAVLHKPSGAVWFSILPAETRRKRWPGVRPRPA